MIWWPQHFECPITSPTETGDLVCLQDVGRECAALVRDMAMQLTILQEALDSLDTIGMAKGILMARQNCTSDEAFEMLKKASQRSNRKLAHVATEMVRSNDRRRRGNRGGTHRPSQPPSSGN